MTNWWFQNVVLKKTERVTGRKAAAAAGAAKLLQLCPTLCDPIDGSPPGFPVPGVLQARTYMPDFTIMWMKNFQLCKLGLEKEEAPEIKLTTFVGS